MISDRVSQQFVTKQFASPKVHMEGGNACDSLVKYESENWLNSWYEAL